MKQRNASRSSKPPPASTQQEEAGADRLVRLQILMAFVVPIVLLGVWLGSRGFFQAP